MLEEESIEAAVIQLEITPVANDFAANRQLLVEKINDLIQHDFNKLVSILYRLDVNENKLRKLLDENAMVDASHIIADLVIEREKQKIISRQQFSKRDDEIDESERW
jgi:hypothetical protein